MASLVKDSRSPFYWARFRDSTGREFTRSTRERERERALEVAQEMENLARSGIEPELPVQQDAPVLRLVRQENLSTEPPSIALEVEQFLASATLLKDLSIEKKADIAASFLNFLGPDISALPLRALSHGLLDGYKAFRLNAGTSKKSFNTELIFLRSLCQSALENGRISKNIVAEIPLEIEEEIVIKPFSLDQIRTLLRVCTHFVRGDDWRGVIAIAIATGRSLYEIANLRSRDLLTDGERPLLRFPESKKDGEAVPTFPLHHLLVEYLFLRNLSTDSAHFLFPSLADRPAEGSHGLNHEFGELVAAAGIEHHSRESSQERILIYEYSARSLEQTLATSEIDAIMNSSFLLRQKRPHDLDAEERIIKAPRQHAQQEHSSSRNPEWFSPPRGTRTI